MAWNMDLKQDEREFGEGLKVAVERKLARKAQAQTPPTPTSPAPQAPAPAKLKLVK